jgi:hypothetical protein
MDDDVERFFEECHADGLSLDDPEAFEHLMDALEKLYQEGNESAAFQEFWDDIREIVARKESHIERIKAIVARWKSIF